MRRMVNCYCAQCRTVREIICGDDEAVTCATCGLTLEQRWWERSTAQRATVWDKRESVVVFEKPDGTFSFPARNDKPLPPGWKKHEARSDRELARIERMTKTRNERRHFDSNGRGFDDYLPPVPQVG